MGDPDQRLPRRRVLCWSGMSGLKYLHHAHWLGATQGGLQWVQSPADTVVGPKVLEHQVVSHSRFSLEGRLERHAPISAIDHRGKMVLLCVPSWLQG